MTYQLQFDYNLRILLVVYEGKICGWDISEVGKEITPHFDALKPSAVIVDLTAITSFDVASHLVRSQAKRDVALVRGNKYAHCACNTSTATSVWTSPNV